jgi:large subunit ribosomal protein L23
MSAFWNKIKKREDQKEKNQISSETKEAVKDPDKKVSSKNNKSSKVKKDKRPKIENYKEKAWLVNRVIIKPVISEDAMNKEAQSKYVFIVDKKVSKSQIAQAVQAKYKVTVNKVNVANYKAKQHRFRYSVGKKNGFRKAIVTVSTGQKIELFSE